MRITLGAVGRLKRAPEKDLCDDYLKRTGKLGRQVGITALNVLEVPESQAGDAAARKSQEAAVLLSKLPSGMVLIGMDERGDALDSPGFSRLIQKQADNGTAELGFVIGGPDGLAPQLLEVATTTLCFGRMTWPHRLVRVMLAEQIYRAVTLMVNHPYHRV